MLFIETIADNPSNPRYRKKDNESDKRKEMMGLLTHVEQKIPMAANVVPTSKSPIYPPKVAALSIVPSEERKEIIPRYINEMTRVKINITITAKYLPKISDEVLIGLVSSNSMVPVFFSSAKRRIVVAGIRISNNQGASIKNGSNVTAPTEKILS